MQVRQHLGGVKLTVQPLAPHRLHGADGVNPLGQGTIDGRVGFMCLDKGVARHRQPKDAHDKQDGQDRQGDQAQTGVKIQHDGDDAEQEDNVTDRQDRGFQKFLHRPHIALQARHQTPHLGLVHERQRDALKMGEHGAADVEQHVFRRLADHGFLHMGGDEVDGDDQRKGDQCGAQNRQ